MNPSWCRYRVPSLYLTGRRLFCPWDWVPCHSVLLLYPSLAHVPVIISEGTGVCWWRPSRPCTCWNYSISCVIHGERSGQLEAFLKQKPHGVSQGKAFCSGGSRRRVGGLWQAGETGAGVLSERFDTPSNSPLSLALVSKQYSSLNCRSAYSCCHKCSLISH